MRGPGTVRWFVGFMVALAVLAGREAGAEPKRADPKSQESARSFYEKATSAFGLGDYARAADLYEQAFELRADSALLYNAAQSHRMAGHKERALQLYKNYVRLFPDSRQTPDARRHAAELEGGGGGRPPPPPPPRL
jgi:tetratricopeptide (TPR) repeat protein